ncbi:MAG TPA: cyclase family protein [Candidatus Binatia bacterium]
MTSMLSDMPARLCLVLLLLVLFPLLPAWALDESKIVDLTYSFDSDTVYWPTARSFELERVAFEKGAAGYWYAANNLRMAEHGGTHMDAPVHFAEHGWTAEQVPVHRLIGPAVVVDVRRQAAETPDYRLSVDDLRRWEGTNGRIPQGAIVLVFTGWGNFWPDKKRYLGSDKPGDTEHLHFPGFSAEAARFLVEQRDIDAVGVDTASMDHGPSKDFPVHRILGAANKPGLENVANLDRLPPKGALLIALPMKIRGGSGGPARIIALLP